MATQITQDEHHQLAHAVWDNVFKVANQLSRAHSLFGYESIARNIDPTLPEILKSLRMLVVLLDALANSDGLGYDEKRLVLNAKRQIGNIEEISVALESGDDASYHAAVEALKNQAAF